MKNLVLPQILAIVAQINATGIESFHLRDAPRLGRFHLGSRLLLKNFVHEQTEYIRRVSGQDECEEGTVFNQKSCSCYLEEQCNIRCHGGHFQNPYDECECMSPWAYYKTFEHDLGENCGAELDPEGEDESGPFIITRVSGQDQCEDGFNFHEVACACFAQIQCEIGCPGGYNNPFECGCLTKEEYWAIYDHDLNIDCMPKEPQPIEITRVSSNDQCMRGYAFDQDACACLSEAQCIFGCDDNEFQNPLEHCGCLDFDPSDQIYDHGLGANCGADPITEPEPMPQDEPIALVDFLPSEEEPEFRSQDVEIPESDSLPIEEPVNPTSSPLRARVEIMSHEGKEGQEQGFVLFEQSGDETKVSGVISGLSGGFFGLYVHELGNLQDGCYSTGGHYNPRSVSYGLDMEMRDEGYLGDFDAGTLGFAIIENVVHDLDLDGPYSIIGRTVVVHSKEVDGEGSRIACGVIGTLQQ